MAATADYYIAEPEWDQPYFNYLGYTETPEEDCGDGDWTVDNLYTNADNKLVGSIVYDRSGYIRHIYIAPAHRGRGLMRRLLAGYACICHHGVTGDFETKALEESINAIVADLRD